MNNTITITINVINSNSNSNIILKHYFLFFIMILSSQNFDKIYRILIHFL